MLKIVGTRIFIERIRQDRKVPYRCLDTKMVRPDDGQEFQKDYDACRLNNTAQDPLSWYQCRENTQASSSIFSQLTHNDLFFLLNRLQKNSAQICTINM